MGELRYVYTCGSWYAHRTLWKMLEQLLPAVM